jgi:hypothetical protein
MERTLGGLETDLGTLKTLPADVRALGTAIAKEESRAALANDKLAEANAALASLQRTVSAVADRPAPVCPACVCNERPAGPAAPEPPATVARKGDDSPRQQ